jgi:hypothetical protein
VYLVIFVLISQSSLSSLIPFEMPRRSCIFLSYYITVLLMLRFLCVTPSAMPTHWSRLTFLPSIAFTPILLYHHFSTHYALLGISSGPLFLPFCHFLLSI